MRKPAHIDSLRALHDHARAHGAALGMSRDALFKLELALEEMLVNVIKYAYAKDAPDRWIQVECDSPAPRTLCVTVRDCGRPFNPLKHADPDTTLPFEERPIGGLGIFLAKKMVHEARYSRENGENVLRLVFKVNQGEGTISCA